MAGFRRASAILPAALACAAVVSGQLIDRTGEPGRFELPNSGLTLEKRADIYMARKMYREAQEIYGQALEKEPGSARIHNKLGISCHQQTNFGCARRHYERASKLDKKYSQAVNNLGTVYHAEGRHKKAAQTYRRALKITPYSASIHSNLGTSLFARGKFKDASKAYLTALQLDPLVFEHRGSNGTLLQERSVGDRGKYYFFMAKAHAQVELYDKALLYIRKALEEGYVRRGKIAAEKAFEPMIEMPAFQRVVFPQVAAAGGPPDP